MNSMRMTFCQGRLVKEYEMENTSLLNEPEHFAPTGHRRWFVDGELVEDFDARAFQFLWEESHVRR